MTRRFGRASTASVLGWIRRALWFLILFLFLLQQQLLLGLLPDLLPILLLNPLEKRLLF